MDLAAFYLFTTIKEGLMSATEERYCTLRHARNTSAQAKLLKNSPKYGYASRFHAAFLMQVAQVQVSVVSDGML